MKTKSTYWLPTYRSPWAVIKWDENTNRWVWVACFVTRYVARCHCNHIEGRTRIVRAWIPLKDGSKA